VDPAFLHELAPWIREALGGVEAGRRTGQ
jgi:hypothetical protein